MLTRDSVVQRRPINSLSDPTRFVSWFLSVFPNKISAFMATMVEHTCSHNVWRIECYRRVFCVLRRTMMMLNNSPDTDTNRIKLPDRHGISSQHKNNNNWARIEIQIDSTVHSAPVHSRCTYKRHALNHTHTQDHMHSLFLSRRMRIQDMEERANVPVYRVATQSNR